MRGDTHNNCLKLATVCFAIHHRNLYLLPVLLFVKTRNYSKKQFLAQLPWHCLSCLMVFGKTNFVLAAADLSSVPAVVPHCSNPLCRHNTPTTGGTVRVTPDTQKLICVCGRTMSMVALEVEQTKSCDQPPATTSFPHHPPSS